VTVNDYQRKRDLRQSRISLKLPVNTDRYAILRVMRNAPLAHSDIGSYTSDMTLNRNLLESFLQDIDADFQAQLDARMEKVRKELEVNRRKAIEALYKAWPQMGGSKKDLDLLAAEIDTPLEDSTLKARKNGQSRHTQGRTVPMDAIRRHVQEALAQTEDNGFLTQSQIKDKVLSEYPDGKVPSVRSGISRILGGYLERGELELEEEGKAGAPNRYRKTGRTAEANLLEP
jgi:hypothetical protein